MVFLHSDKSKIEEILSTESSFVPIYFSITVKKQERE